LRTDTRILFVRNGSERFVQLDRDLLAQEYRVTDCYLRSPRSVNPPALWRLVAAHDLVFGWFASWHTFLPVLAARLLGKPSLLVIGGYDLADMPEIGYGHQRGGPKRWISRATMRLATCLVTHAEYSRREAQRNADLPADRVHVVYLGVPDLVGSLTDGPRPAIALTVGNVDRPNLRRKGLEPFVRAAAFLPNAEFILVGDWRDDAIRCLRGLATPNTTFTGRVDDQTLLGHYRRASVYVQASAHEGFGMSLAEAMLAGCVPIVTRAGALPEVVGEAGFYLSSSSPEAIADAIRMGLGVDGQVRQRARERIITAFPLSLRRDRLCELVRDLVPTA
jgi:glycosyltransferase involved in cell wall biosynthesis